MYSVDLEESFDINVITYYCTKSANMLEELMKLFLKTYIFFFLNKSFQK